MLLFGKKDRTFKYSVPELLIFKNITVKSNECKNIDDLKKKIASDLNLPEDQLYFKNVPNQKIKNIDDNYEFQLIFVSSYPDIDLLLPSGQKVLIKDCYKKKFKEIFPFIENEGVYFSDSCINHNIHLYLNKNIIAQIDFPFLPSNQNSVFELKLIGKTIELKHGHYHFIVSENEDFDEVVKLVHKARPNLNVRILDSHNNKPDTMKSSENYSIRIEKIVRFKNIDQHSVSEFISVDLYDTVSDVQNSLAKKLNQSLNGQIKPEKIIIYDKDENQIPDSNKPLRKFQILDNEFYFEINAKIEKNPDQKKAHILKPKVDEPEKIKPFFYSISELSIFNEFIHIDTAKYKTIFDLKKKIASNLHAPDKFLQFKNQEEENLKRIKAFYNFNIQFNSPKPDIEILIPGKKQIRIKNCYNKKFNYVFSFIRKAGYYYSPLFIKNNIRLLVNNKEISCEDYPFLISDKNTFFEIRLIGKPIVLKYDNVHFAFSNGEHMSDAIKVIKEVFQSQKVYILDSDGYYDDKLNSNKKYSLRIETKVKFKNYKDGSKCHIYIDKHDKVSVMLKLLAKKLRSKMNEHIKPIDLILYSHDKYKIYDLNQPIINIQELNEIFYFKIIKNEIIKHDHDHETDSDRYERHKHKDEKPRKHDMPKKYEIKKAQDDSLDIIFIFLKNNDQKQPDQIREKVPLKSTIVDTAKLIANKLKIKDLIFLKYKSRIKYKSSQVFYDKFLRLQTIEEVKKMIEEKDPITGKIQYKMYAEIQPKKKEDKIDIQDSDENKKHIPLRGGTYVYAYSDDYYSDNDCKAQLKPFTIVPKDKSWSPKNKYQKKTDENDKVRKSRDLDDDRPKYKQNEILTNPHPKKRSSSAARFLPKVKTVDSITLNHSFKKEPSSSRSNFYKFEFKGNEKMIELQNDLTLESQETMIKIEFGIPTNDQLIFNFLEGSGENKKNINKKKTMNSFINGKIFISIDNKTNPILILDFDQVKEYKKTDKTYPNDVSGEVYQVYFRNNKEMPYILKIMTNVNHRNMKRYFNDHQALRFLDHPYILKTTGIFLGDELHSPSIVLEYYTCNLEELFKKKELNNVSMFKCIYQIVEGMRYVHSKGIIHRNLNPKSIYISERKIKIGDFEVCQLISVEDQMTWSNINVLETMQFIAPELLNDSEHNEKVDVYSFGVLMSFILNEGKYLKINKNQKFKINLPTNLTMYTKSLIERCLSYEPDDRPSFENIRNEIEKNYTQIMFTKKSENERIKSLLDDYKIAFHKKL